MRSIFWHTVLCTCSGAAPGTLYSVRRTRYHSVPVYTKLKFGNTQQLTVIKNIEGDIWVSSLSDILQRFLSWAVCFLCVFKKSALQNFLFHEVSDIECLTWLSWDFISLPNEQFYKNCAQVPVHSNLSPKYMDRTWLNSEPMSLIQTLF